MKATSGIQAIALAALFIGAVNMPQTAQAQQQELSVEELEAFIEEQKAALEQARANRDETENRVREVRDAMAEQEARRERILEELEALCEEQEEVSPGTYDDCKAQLDS